MYDLFRESVITAQDSIATGLNGGVSGLTREVTTAYSLWTLNSYYFTAVFSQEPYFAHYRMFTMFKAFINVVIKYILRY